MDLDPVLGYLAFWGKARETAGADGVAPSRHPAACHMLDVAAVALEWMTAARPRIPGLPSPETYHATIAYLVALHDLGKFSRPFQRKVALFWPAVLGEVERLEAPRHDSAGFWMLTERMPEALASVLPDMAERERAEIARAICGHHGRPPEEEPAHARRAVCAICLAAAAAFVSDIYGIFQPKALPAMTAQDITALSWWLAGLTVMADWIGSNEAWFAFHPDCEDLHAYALGTRAAAREAVRQAGILPIAPRHDLDVHALLPAAADLSPMQALAGRLDLGPRDGPSLILIEDQTGSGKTEAALLLAHRLMVEKGASGLFIALPTMATANALHGRLESLYRALFAAGTEPSLVLAHGKRRLHERFMAAVAAGTRAASGASEPADETASAQCAGWIAADRRRTFLADCGVGTIDQALHAVLPTRHAPLRLFGLSDRVLIVDEAHAYDTYMGEELIRLIEFQTRLGGSTIILSATLPLAKRRKLAAAFGAAGACVEENYPLVTTVSADGVRELPCPPNKRLEREIFVTRLKDAAAAVSRIAEAAAKGAAVGWIRNTVDDAVAAQAALSEAGITAILFHARFAMGDRQIIEQRVQTLVGRNSQPAQRRQVIVGTQVMEQSLDIDFDVLISDLAPVDLLLQRAGRLWRHERPWRPVAAPEFFIASPEPVAEPATDWLKDLSGTAAVYRHPGLLWRSARAIFEKPVLRLPADVRALIEAAYAEDAATPGNLQERSEAAVGVEQSHKSIAWMNLLKWHDGYSIGNGAWESDVRTPTRLSEPSRTFRLAVVGPDGLDPWCAHENAETAWALSEVSVPLRKLQAGTESPEVTALQKGWSKFDAETPVIVLRQEGEDWLGVGQDGTKQAVPVRYSAATGFDVY